MPTILTGGTAHMWKARILEIGLGVALVAAAFAYGYPQVHFTNALLCGVLAAAVAAVAGLYPMVRYVNTFLGFWIAASGMILPGLNQPTFFTNLFIGVGLIVLSCVGPAASTVDPDEPVNLPVAA